MLCNFGWHVALLGGLVGAELWHGVVKFLLFCFVSCRRYSEEGYNRWNF